MAAAPIAAGQGPQPDPRDDRRILEGYWETPDGRPLTVVRAGSEFKITGPSPPGGCPRPGGEYGTVVPTTDPSTYVGDTFRYDTEDCSVVGRAPLTVKVAQDPKVPEIQSLQGDSEGQSVGGAKRPDWQAGQDSDGDNIPDWTERNGVNILAKNKAGKPADVMLNLPRMGADPNVRDVFVEVDSMQGREFFVGSLKNVQKRFLDSPGGGINLHVDAGSNSAWMNPRTGESWEGFRSEGTANLPFKNTLVSTAEFSALKTQFFREDVRGPYFRYAIAANKIAGELALGGAAGVVLWGLSPRWDFILSSPLCGKETAVCGTPAWEQISTFTHELGHSLGLGHGGGTHVNYKPNYFSVMNYSFVFTGLGSRSDLLKPGKAEFDYSRFGPSEVTRVNENQINEQAGVQLPNATAFSLVRYCADPEKEGGTPFQAGMPVDWNCNKKIETAPVSFDVNFDANKEVLESFNDWAGLQFGPDLFLAAGSGARAVASSTAPGQETKSLRQLLKEKARTLGDTKAPKIKLRSKGRRVTVTARDNKRVDRVVVGAGRKIVSSPAQKTGRKLRVKIRLKRKRGRQRVAAQAADWVGNRSRPLKRKIRVR